MVGTLIETAPGWLGGTNSPATMSGCGCSEGERRGPACSVFKRMTPRRCGTPLRDYISSRPAAGRVACGSMIGAFQRQRRRSNGSIAQLAALVTIVLAACDNPTPTASTPEVEPSGVVFPTAAASTLPAGARETRSMRLFGSDDVLVAYEVPDGDGEVREYCIQFVSASSTETTCEPLGQGDLTIVQGQSNEADTSPSLIRGSHRAG
jgi:hypothetical protein